ncbi:MAG: thiol-activated cytolysin family protein [Desulfarculales bacterium]|nr:thiol-activated cytolysin family protein [Desulfarculales bacterium]
MSDIDSKLRALAYNENEVLVFKGTGVSSFIPKEGHRNGNRYIVVTRSLRSLENSEESISVVGAIASRTYPGALLLANSRLVDNQPDVVPVERAPLKMRVDLPGMAEDATFEVENLENGLAYEASLNKVLDIWNTKYSSRYKTLAKLVYNESMVYSESQIKAKFGMGITEVSKSMNIDFSAIMERKTSVMVVMFKQIYFTVNTALASSPSMLFADKVKWDDLAAAGVSASSPPVMVTHAGYGRTVFLKLETASNSSEVEAAFKAAVNNMNISSDVKYKEILNNTTFTAYVLGGGAQSHIEVLQKKNMADIAELLAKNAEYSPRNPAYPIYYATAFLKDWRMAAVKYTAQYVETGSQEFTDGIVALNHSGWYVGQYKVTWEEHSYNAKGELQVTNKSWDKNEKDLTAPFSTEINLPGNARNICVKAWACTGLAWDWWRVIFERTGLDLLPRRTFSIGGTSLSPSYSIKP